MFVQCEHSVCENQIISAATRDDLSKFPFAQLAGLNNMDYAGISTIMATLKTFFAIQEFYDNPNNCLSNVFEFIMANCNFLIKNVESAPALKSLLGLLHELLVGMNNLVPPVGFTWDDIEMITAMLIKVMDSAQETLVKLEAGKIVRELIEMTDPSNLTDLDVLSSKACAVFDAEQSVIELSRLFRAFLSRRNDLWLDLSPIIDWVENYCVEYVNEETEPQVLIHIFNCWLAYYDTCGTRDNLTGNLKRHLSLLCMVMVNPLLQDSSKRLLAILIKQLHHVKPKLLIVWPQKRIEIVKETLALPDIYQQWPRTSSNIFFVIAYLQILHSKLLWSFVDVLEALHIYLSVAVCPQGSVLKAILILYPAIIYNPHFIIMSSNWSMINNINMILLERLRVCRSFSQLVTNEPVQMIWLMANADMTLKCRLLVHWLHSFENDDQIVALIERAGAGCFLVNFLIHYPDAPIAYRVSQLITRLPVNLPLVKTIEAALPRLCSWPQIFSQILQVKPTIPRERSQILDLIKMVSASLPFLSEKKNIQAVCSYGHKLLTAVKNLPDALILFCHFPASVRFLAAKSTSSDDATALYTINLLRRLLNIQVSCNVVIHSTTTVCFAKILQGNPQRIAAGLHLLYVLLIRAKQPLLLTYPKHILLDLYHYTHTLIRQEGTSAIALRVLSAMIKYHNNLAFSLATPCNLRLVCNMEMPGESLEAFLDFLDVWLLGVTAVSYTDIPVGQLRCFLTWVPDNKEKCNRIIGLLNHYSNLQIAG